MVKKNEIINLHSEEKLVSKIYTIRGRKVMLDQDLAELYEVQPKRLNEQVKRNIERFPEPLFMFKLTKDEWDSLRSQIATLEYGKGKHSKYLPYAFTEQGVSMLSAVLTSKKAIQVSIQIIIAFTKMREMLSAHTHLRRKILEMEKKYDSQFREVFFALKKLIDSPQPKKRKKEIGFHTQLKK